ncbi:PREDICTED: telomerase reverse transcriptase-like, partial [Eufriesea mexicana]|uniref:telomerase reverse transcriptase-like n=1 Tax=Eufriesea mexicana TaxID=516756 RepID=UPI00083BDBF1
MDDLTALNVKEVFGIDFQKFCLRRKILLKRDKCGAFMVPNIDTLIECICALEYFKIKINNQLKIMQKCTSSKNSLDDKHDVSRLNDGHKIKTKKKKFHEEVRYDNLSFIKSELNIYLFNTSSSLSSPDFIINNYEDSVPMISPLLDQFKKKHQKFHYFSVLRHLINKKENDLKENNEKTNDKKENDKKSECKYAVNKKQLCLFFDLILSKVVPLKMFGKFKNLKKIKTTIFCLLDAPSFKAFNLKPFINNLDIFSITWLQNIKSIRIKWFIMAKFARWFFVGFIFRILRTCFHITASRNNNKRLYIMRSTWRSVKQKFIKKAKHSNILQPDVKCNEWNPPIGTYKLFPKYSDVRPIFKPEDNDNNKIHEYTILKFLKQLHNTKYGITNFPTKWESIVQHKYDTKPTKLYFICCDVMNAFGSIIQEKLYNIIQSLCKDLPEFLILKYYVIKSEKFRSEIICYKQYFSDPNLQLPLASDALYTHTNYNQCQWIKKSWLLEKISKYIFYQKVKINVKSYIIGKGIVQGSMLSPILSDIYYNFILHEEMATYLKAGEIIKYMDDILYVTENEILAKQFLQLTKKGIPQYNCYFKQSKTQTNVVCDGNKAVNSITYIGYKINCTSLEIIPVHPSTDLYYLVSFFGINNGNPLKVLERRLYNIASLKLSKFILDKAINSEKTILIILKRICLLQAKRACILIKELFHYIPGSIQNILKVIKNSNERITRYIIRMFLLTHKIKKKSSKLIWNKRILHMLWRSYKTVLLQDKVLQEYFITS